MDKAELRKLFIQKRRSLSLAEWQEKSLQVCEHLQRLPLFQQAKTVLAYCSANQELDLKSLILSEDKVWGLPRCVAQSMVWHHWTSNGLPLQPGAFGIIEPHPDSPALASEQVDLILVPCVACDLRGYRLGYGGGFYDRLFSAPEWQDKPAIGIVFEFALFEELAIDPWDQPLQGVCTETGFIGSRE